MNLIVAVNNEWSIGKENEMLYHMPTDLKYFKDITTGKIMILGRKTLESLPKGKPLPKRDHILITRNKKMLEEKYEDAPGIIKIVDSIDSLLSFLKEEHLSLEEIYVMGGGTIYEQLLEYCEKAYVTKVNESLKGDTFFPNLDEKENWSIESISKPVFENGFEYTFQVYLNKSPKAF